MTFAPSSVIVSLVLLCGCSLPDKQAFGPQALLGDGGLLTTRLRVVAVSGNRVDVEWRIENHNTTRVWVAQSWGTDESKEFAMPIAFLAPPSDLLLVFALPQQTRVHQNVEGTAHRKFTCLAPRSALSGIIQLALPLKMEDGLLSPYELPPGVESGGIFEGQAKVAPQELSALSGIQMAVQHWSFNPDERLSDAGADPSYRLFLAKSVASGDADYYGRREFVVQRWSLSDRLSVQIPLATAKRLLKD
jgi:hypothetical protein